VLTTITANAQRLDDQKVTFKSERLPLNPIANLEGYNFTVETPYPANNDDIINRAKFKYEEELANYPNTVLEAEAKHEEAMLQYDKDVITAQENFKLESAAYDQMSAVEKIALQEKKPVIKLPRKPYYSKPREPIYSEPSTTAITFDPSVLAGSYLKLAGYKKAESGNILIAHVVLNDFEYETPERKYTEKSVYNKTTKQTVKQKVYYYTTAYNRPTYVRIQHGNEVLFEGTLESSTVSKSLKTDSSPNLKTLEKRSVKESMQLASEYINSNYGYSQVDRALTVRWVKNKKEDFNDLEGAKDNALTSYEDFNGGKNSAELLEAIASWKVSLSESDLEDKKARINKKVTIILLLNLIEAELILQNPTDAKAHMKTLKTIKLSYANTLLQKKLEKEIKDVSKRVAAKL
jgi:hypothetical protein